MKVNNNNLELYWNDLTLEAKNVIMDMIGENMNWDVFPLVTIPISDNSVNNITEETEGEVE